MLETWCRARESKVHWMRSSQVLVSQPSSSQELLLTGHRSYIPARPYQPNFLLLVFS